MVRHRHDRLPRFAYSLADCVSESLLQIEAPDIERNSTQQWRNTVPDTLSYGPPSNEHRVLFRTTDLDTVFDTAYRTVDGHLITQLQVLEQRGQMH